MYNYLDGYRKVTVCYKPIEMPIIFMFPLLMRELNIINNILKIWMLGMKQQDVSDFVCLFACSLTPPKWGTSMSPNFEG